MFDSTIHIRSNLFSTKDCLEKKFQNQRISLIQKYWFVCFKPLSVFSLEEDSFIIQIVKFVTIFHVKKLYWNYKSSFKLFHCKVVIRHCNRFSFTNTKAIHQYVTIIYIANCYQFLQYFCRTIPHLPFPCSFALLFFHGNQIEKNCDWQICLISCFCSGGFVFSMIFGNSLFYNLI